MLLEDLGTGQKHIILNFDSESAIRLMNNQVYHARIKLIDMQYHFARKIIKEGGILVQKIKTTDNLAYAFTKVVIGIKLNHCLNLINILQV